MTGFPVGNNGRNRTKTSIQWAITNQSVGTGGHAESIPLGEGGHTHGIVLFGSKHSVTITKARMPAKFMFTKTATEAQGFTVESDSETFTDDSGSQYTAVDFGLRFYKRSTDAVLSVGLYESSGNAIKIDDCVLNAAGDALDFTFSTDTGTGTLNLDGIVWAFK